MMLNDGCALVNDAPPVCLYNDGWVCLLLVLPFPRMVTCEYGRPRGQLETKHSEFGLRSHGWIVGKFSWQCPSVAPNVESVRLVAVMANESGEV